MASRRKHDLLEQAAVSRVQNAQGRPAEGDDLPAAGLPGDLGRKRAGLRGPDGGARVGVHEVHAPVLVGVGDRWDAPFQAGGAAPTPAGEQVVARAVSCDDAEESCGAVGDAIAVGGPAGIADSAPGERPADISLRVDRRELAPVQDDDLEEAVRRPACLRVGGAAEVPLRAVGPDDPGAVRRVDEQRPAVGRRVSTAAALRTPSASRTVSGRCCRMR